VAISAATLSNLSSGVFVGIIADEPETLLETKAFHAQIINEPKRINKEKESWVELPVVREVTERMLQEYYQRIVREAKEIVRKVIGNRSNDPEAI
jgi:hypothetical protein